MNIYTNPADQVPTAAPGGASVSHTFHMVAPPEGKELLTSTDDLHNHYSDLDLETSDLGSESSDLDSDNAKNEQIEDAEYLEPQVCMAHRPLPEVIPQGQPEVNLDPEVKVKRKPQRFVRPKSPVGPEPLPPTTPPTQGPAQNRMFPPEVEEEPEAAGHVYEDAEEGENEYAEIPGENFYETLDEMKRSLATMAESRA